MGVEARERIFDPKYHSVELETIKDHKAFVLVQDAITRLDVVWSALEDEDVRGEYPIVTPDFGDKFINIGTRLDPLAMGIRESKAGRLDNLTVFNPKENVNEKKEINAFFGGYQYIINYSQISISLRPQELIERDYSGWVRDFHDKSNRAYQFIAKSL